MKVTRSLTETPFAGVFDVKPEARLLYFESLLREYVFACRAGGRSMPPSAFLFSETESHFFNGLEFSTPASFLEAIRFHAADLDCSLCCIAAEVGNPAQDDPIVVFEVSTPDDRAKGAFEVSSPQGILVGDQWEMILASGKDFVAVGVDQFMGDVFASL